MSVQGSIRLAHGAGARLTADLIREVFAPAFGNEHTARAEDAAEVRLAGTRLAFSTDAHVVRPLFFAGGDIGKLAVCGTVNDLAMKGARPRYLSLGFVIAEGFAIAELRRIAESIGAAAREADVEVAAGDTKVVERGAADGLFITAAGIGEIPEGRDLSPARLAAGDALVVSAPVAEHGLAVLDAREKLGLGPAFRSDCAPLGSLVEAAFASGAEIHALRDPTRGGLATVCLEFAGLSGRRLVLRERDLPVRPAVASAAALLGLDPLYVACEGVCLAAVAGRDAGKLVAALRAHPLGVQAGIVGRVEEGPAGAEIETAAGGRRRLAWLEGEPLPRIC
ncbi:MAG TPA: hydrogenase expression/formation protein HypE [Planctomycetota bacterium]|nr:hydrogenase expression/formation protein HypE [Planctomycetota bacterium]